MMMRMKNRERMLKVLSMVRELMKKEVKEEEQGDFEAPYPLWQISRKPIWEISRSGCAGPDSSPCLLL